MDLHLKNLFGRYEEQFGSGPGLGPGSGTCLLKIQGISPNFLKSIYKASAALYRTDPWKRFRPDHLFGIRVGKDSDWPNKKQPFSCCQLVNGDLGFHLFRSEADALKMTSPRETIRVPGIEVLRVTCERDEIMFLPNKKMVKSLALEPSGEGRYPVVDVAFCDFSGGVRFRHPTLEELRFAYGVMRAVSLVHPLLEQDYYSRGTKWSRVIDFEPFIETVDIQFPPEMAKSKSNDLVAVTVSYPPGHGYEEKSANSTPTKRIEHKDETFLDVKTSASVSTVIRKCVACDKEVYSDQYICCNQCRGVVYCSALCQKQHWKESHKSTCGLYKAVMEREDELAMNVFVFPCLADNSCKWLESLGIHQKGMWRRKCSCYSHSPFGLLPVTGGVWDSWGGLDHDEYPSDSPFDGFSTPVLLSGWSEYYNLRSLPLSSPIADILSHPLTVYYILTTLNITTKNLLLKGKEVIVHYLGPERELDWMPAFAELGHLLNGTGNLQIVMVGPNVPTNLSGTTSGINSRIRVNFVKGLYQDEATYLSSPHVVVGLNCDLEDYGIWGGALELIKSMGVPAFFTNQTEISCANDKQVIRGVGLHITHPVTPNPFRSPVRNYGASDNLPSYSNGFVLGVNAY